MLFITISGLARVHALPVPQCINSYFFPSPKQVMKVRSRVSQKKIKRLCNIDFFLSIPIKNRYKYSYTYNEGKKK